MSPADVLERTPAVGGGLPGAAAPARGDGDEGPSRRDINRFGLWLLLATTPLAAEAEAGDVPRSRHAKQVTDRLRRKGWIRFGEPPSSPADLVDLLPERGESVGAQHSHALLDPASRVGPTMEA